MSRNRRFRLHRQPPSRDAMVRRRKRDATRGDFARADAWADLQRHYGRLAVGASPMPKDLHPHVKRSEVFRRSLKSPLAGTCAVGGAS